MMKKEIGSFYEEEDIEEKENCYNTIFDYIENGRNATYVSSGRESIKAVLECVEKDVKNKICILPLYTCDTVIIPFVESGWTVLFYGVDNSLFVDVEELTNLYDEIKPSVLLVHTYYGCDNLKFIRDIINKWRQNDGLIVVEDMTQSLFMMDKTIEIADYYVGSLRKWFSIPEGGFIASKRDLNVKTDGNNCEYIRLKLEAQHLKYLYLHEKLEDKEEFLKINRRAEDYLYEIKKIYSISEETIRKLKKYDISEIYERRMNNAITLNNGANHFERVIKIVNITEEAPIYFPILCESEKYRSALQKYLISKQVFAPILWPIPSYCNNYMTYSVRKIYDRLLAIPCDHRYGTREMEYIINLIKEFE